jgi:hypothetical protein
LLCSFDAFHQFLSYPAASAVTTQTKTEKEIEILSGTCKSVANAVCLPNQHTPCGVPSRLARARHQHRGIQEANSH